MDISEVITNGGVGFKNELSFARAGQGSIKDTQSAAPTITYGASAMVGGVTNYAWNRTLGAKSTLYNYCGIAPEMVNQAGPTASTYDYVNSALAVSTTLGAGSLTASFYHTGASLDIILYLLASRWSLYVDDKFIGVFETGPLQAGTAQAGGASTITLASGASAVDNFYNQYFAKITGGTGVLGEVREIASYVGSTKVATVSTAWTTPPDATTTYEVHTCPTATIAGTAGNVRYLNLAWSTREVRKITVVSGIFCGTVIGPYDTLSPAPGLGTLPLLVVGDSHWEGAYAPSQGKKTLIESVARGLGAQAYNLGSGGTGLCNPLTGSGSSNRLNFEDRICPAPEAWRYTLAGTAGTFKISVTVGADTQTTTALAYNATRTTIETALNALSNVSGVGNFAVARGDYNTPHIFLARNLTGATIAFNTGSLTGSITYYGPYEGDVKPNIPKDLAGNSLPFILFMPGSGNDGSASDAQVEAAAIRVAQGIIERFPTAIPIFSGPVGEFAPSDGVVITAANLSRNAAYKAGADLLPKINGSVPFIDPYTTGLGGQKWLMGTGDVAAPTSGKNDILKSRTLSGHGTGDGAAYIATHISQDMQALLAV